MPSPESDFQTCTGCGSIGRAHPHDYIDCQIEHLRRGDDHLLDKGAVITALVKHTPYEGAAADEHRI